MTTMPSIPTASDNKPTRPLEDKDGSHQPADGADVGGMPTNLQHGLFDDDRSNGDVQPTEPLDADWTEQEAAAKGDHDTGAITPQSGAERREPGHIDSALESLGEAITDPLREGSKEMSDAGPDSRSPGGGKPGR